MREAVAMSSSAKLNLPGKAANTASRGTEQALPSRTLTFSQSLDDFRGVLTGVMPKWCRYLHKSTSVFMCLLFGGMGFITARLMAAPHTVPDKARLFVSFLFVLLAVGGNRSPVLVPKKNDRRVPL